MGPLLLPHTHALRDPLARHVYGLFNANSTIATTHCTVHRRTCINVHVGLANALIEFQVPVD